MNNLKKYLTMGQSKRMYEEMEINVLDIDLDDDAYQSKHDLNRIY